MGVEYAILDASHSRRFILGKYFHIDILETEPRRMTRAEVRAAVEQAFSRTGEAAWKEHLAMRIWAFCESADWQVTIDLDGEEAAGAAVVLVPSCAYVSYKYRPRASFDVDYHESLVRRRGRGGGG